jgi:putative heme-binding domain-containing protein
MKSLPETVPGFLGKIGTRLVGLALLAGAFSAPAARAQDGLPAVPVLESQLLAEDPAALARAARERGEAARGAVLFYQQHLTCAKCHAYGAENSPLGPDLTKPERELTDVFLVESILQPSKEIREGYEPVVVITDEGKTVTGLLAEDLPDRLVLRDPLLDGELVTLPKETIDERAQSPLSIMTPGLVNQLANRQQFLDQLEPEPSLYAPPPLPEYEQRVDHAGIIAELGPESYRRGEEIYSRLCVNCHGTKDEPGSLPTSLRFASDAFRNGSDPYSMYQTLTHGFGLMVAQAWMVPQQKYDAIHYIRETYLKPYNPTQYVTVDAGYLAGLPKGDTRGPAPSTFEPWVAMDYGPNLIASYEIGDDASNFAYKGNAIRLNAGPGGVTRGQFWMIFDEDTLRMAAGWSGDEFIDYNAIMLNGKHAVHPRIVGRLHFENKTGPGWGNPETGSFDDPRFLGRDDRPYGPLPRDWAHYKGLYHHGNRVVVSYTVGRTTVLEMPSVDLFSSTPVFTRIFNIGPRSADMIVQVLGHSDPASKLLALARADPAWGRIVLFGPQNALSEKPPHPPEEPGEGESLAFDGATCVEIAQTDDLDMTGSDYTIRARIKTESDGTIFSKTAPTKEWVPNGKSLFVRGGKLTFDVGWVGAVRSERSLNDNRWHDVAMTYRHETGQVRLFIDGRPDGEKRLGLRLETALRGRSAALGRYDRNRSRDWRG